MLALLLSTALATCDYITRDQALEVQSPGVLVLGERHGHEPDLSRATDVIATLSKSHKVTVAIEAVHEQFAQTVEQFNQGELSPGKFKRAIDWDNSWGHAYKPYKKLLKAGSKGSFTLVAAGLTLGPKPEDREITIPEGYAERLEKMMQGHGEMPDHIRERFATSMTWRDFHIAELAAQGWDGEGVLVVLTGRGHVLGSLGTNWQLERLVEAPVKSVVLAPGPNPKCYPGDRVWAL